MSNTEEKTVKLAKKIKITGTIELLTGLHIGGTDQGVDIGGIDKLIIRNPLNNQPYIPGSSLKGKLRSLIELKDGTIGITKMQPVEYFVSEDPKSRAFKLFGSATTDEHQRPSRLIVRDAILENPEQLENLELPYAEAKTEVAIDRITAKANPRTLERVPAGAKFKLNMVLNVIVEDDQDEQKIQNELLCTLIDAMRLLEDDYLGGHGSRGYGQIRFTGIKVIDDQGNDLTYYWEKFKVEICKEKDKDLNTKH